MLFVPLPKCQNGTSLQSLAPADLYHPGRNQHHVSSSILAISTLLYPAKRKVNLSTRQFKFPNTKSPILPTSSVYGKELTHLRLIKDSSAHTPDPRAKRRADASADLQKLYQTSTATTTATAADAPPQIIDARSLAAALAPGAVRFTGRRPTDKTLGESQREWRPMQNQPQRLRGERGQEGDRERQPRIFPSNGYDKGRRRLENADQATTNPRFTGVRNVGGVRAPSSDKSWSTDGERKQGGPRKQGGDKGRKRKSSKSSSNRNEDGGNSAGSKADELELQAYEQEKVAMRASKPVAFEPTTAALSASVDGAGPAFVSGVSGMNQLLNEKMEQARWFAEGRQWIEGKKAWESGRQKREMLDVFEKLNAGKEGQDQLLMKLLSGGYLAQYPALKDVGKQQDTLGQVERVMAQNESYEPSDQKGLLEKVRSVVAATPPSSRAGGKQGARQSVKA